MDIAITLGISRCAEFVNIWRRPCRRHRLYDFKDNAYRRLINRLREDGFMLINVDDLMAKNLDLAYDETPDAFEALTEITSGGGVEFTGTIRFDLTAYRIGELIVVDGRFKAPVRFSCVRCLSEFDTDLAADFKLTYARESDSAGRGPDPPELALKSEEIGLLRFSGLHIDLRPALQEELIMALPMRPLCKDDCKGLCPRCGANLNEGDCNCRRQQGHPGFAVLKNLKK